MIQLILLGVGILGCMATWHWMAKRTYLDEARDQLFDLRDGVLRRYFLASKHGLGDPLYLELRTLINGHLRFTHRASFLGFVALLWMSRNDAQLREAIKRESERHFSTKDAELAEFSYKVRERAARIMFHYMVRTSLLARFIMLISVPVICVMMLVSHWRKFKELCRTHAGINRMCDAAGHALSDATPLFGKRFKSLIEQEALHA